MSLSKWTELSTDVLSSITKRGIKHPLLSEQSKRLSLQSIKIHAFLLKLLPRNSEKSNFSITKAVMDKVLSNV